MSVDRDESSPDRSIEESPYTITPQILQIRLTKENKGRLRTQACIALIASVAALSFGTVLGWASPVSRKLMKLGNYNLTEEELLWVSSLMPLGCSVGTTIWTYSANHMGPKHTMVIQTPFYVFLFLITVTIKRIEIFLAGRFFSGFMSIAFLISGECLLEDCVHPSYLRNMLVFFNSSISLGILLSYLVGYFLSYWWLTIMITTIPILNAICLLFLPESPVYLFEKNQQKAEESLSWYRGPENIYSELRSIKKDWELRKTSANSEKYMFFSKVVLKAFFITFGLMSFKVFSGYYAFIFFNVEIHTKNSLPVFSRLFDSIIFGVVLYVCKLISNIVHMGSPFGVRKPLLISCLIISIAFTVLTIYLFIQTYLSEVAKYMYWLPLSLLSIFVIGYEAGLGIYTEIILIDYLPYQVYSIAKTLIRTCYWFQIFLLTKFFITIRNVSTNYIAFGILTIISYLSIAYCTIFIIETKDKNLIQIQLEIGGNPIGHRAAYKHRHYSKNSNITIT